MATRRAAIALIKAATPAVTIAGLVGAAVSPGIAERLYAGGGFADPQLIVIQSQVPIIRCSTRELSALSSIGTDGVECSAVDTYWHVKEAWAVRKSGGAHEKVSLAKAYGLPRSISFSRQEDATLDLEFMGISADGTTNPLSVTPAQSLPAGWTADEVYSVAKVVIGSDEFDVEDGTLDFGLEPRTLGPAVYATEAWLESRNPSLTFSTSDVSALATLGVGGKSSAGAIYFRKRLSGSTFYADNTANHVKIAWAAGLALPRESSGAESVAVPVDVKPTWNGSNAILAITVGVAIP